MTSILIRFVQPMLIIAFFCTGLVVLVLALGPPPQGLAPGEDKVQHFLAFTALAALAMVAFEDVRASGIAIGLLAGGVGIEVLQAIPMLRRSASWADVLADAAGVAVGLGLGLLLRMIWRNVRQRLLEA